MGIRARPVLKADNPTAICEPVVYTIVTLNISQPYRPVTGTALFYFNFINCSQQSDSLQFINFQFRV
jgi:hypothetical protein